MQLRTITLAAVLPLVNAYPVTADDLQCRSGPGTSYGAVTSYNSGTDVTISCQTTGEDINGNSIWDKTGDGCYVSDYFVETGSDDMVEDECDSGGGGGGSEYNGPISRKEIMERGNFWVDQGIPYSMEATEPDQTGREYRTDCSGFVSMAYHANSPGYSTVSLPEIAEAIEWADLKEGDMVGTLGDGTGGANGHVVIFQSWTSNDMQEFNTIECKGTDGCVAWTRPIGFAVGAYSAKPYRYTRVSD